jgi:transposase
VRAYVLQMLSQGRGAEAIEMLVDLLWRLREAHTSTVQRLEQALRQLYGRRSEKLSANTLQMLLSFLSAEEATPAVAEAVPAAAVQTAPPPASGDNTGSERCPRRVQTRGAKALPEHLERREVVVPVAPELRACPCCGQERTPMGEEVSQRLELEPARFFVLVEKRPKLACARCKEGVVSAPASETPLPGALPGPGLLSQLVVGKYRDGLPLHRQQAIFDKRYGVKLAPSTLGDWLANACDLLPPVVEVLKQRNTDIFSALEELKPQVAPKTPLGKAITYATHRYVPLGRFLEDGRLPLDNGEVERLNKLIAIGRNNYLFAGSDAAGHRAAHAYSLVLSCYRLKIDPWAYLRDVLPKLGDTRFPASRLAELLPEAWLQQQREKA